MNESMKRVAKPVFFIVAIVILLFTTVSIVGISTHYADIETTIIKGVNQIRWGIDIRGGVDVTFTPPEGTDATDDELAAAAEVMRQRLVTLNITDYEVYTDTNTDHIIVRFPWKSDETDFNADDAIKELGDTAELSFREGTEVDSAGLPTGTTADTVILTGSDVDSAKAVYTRVDENSDTYKWVVSLKLKDSGKEAFSEATSRLVGTGTAISIWMDDTMISAPTVNSAITNGEAIIEGSFTADSAQELANKINGGALPFKLETQNYSTIDPTLGLGARDAMVLSGIIAFAVICIYMILLYRLPGFVACIALAGQVGLTLAALTGFVPGIASSTLTIPGIAGIILSLGMGVDANIITAERIKEEINSGKSIDGSIEIGYKRAFSAILDGNITTLIVAIILMGTFGTPDSVFAIVLKPLFAIFNFPASTEGSISSFGYTLMVGIICNFIFGILASKYMVKSISRFKCFRKPKFYGGEQ